MCLMPPVLWRQRLPTQPKTGNKLPIALYVFSHKVVQETAALAYQHQQAPSRMVVVLVHGEMLGEAANPAREQGDLDFGGARIAFVGRVLLHVRRFLFLRHRHRGASPSLVITRF